MDKNKDGKEKNVKIDTPLGGLHVRADETSAADVGLPAYPGAHIAPDKDGDKSADVHLGFGEWQLRVKVVTYDTSDPQDKVVAFYQKAMGRYGDVIRCEGDQPVGTPTVTREGLTCSDDKSKAHVHVSENSSLSLKSGIETAPAYFRNRKEFRDRHPLFAGGVAIARQQWKAESGKQLRQRPRLHLESA